MGAGAGDAVGESGPREILVSQDDLENARQRRFVVLPELVATVEGKLKGTLREHQPGQPAGTRGH
jgi:hypothetical protein